MSIKLDLKIFIFIALFFVTKQIEIYLILMIFALLHELGHLGVGMLLGFKPNSITINPLGVSLIFKTKIEDAENILCIRRLIIALAGPMVNLAILIIGILLKRDIIIYGNLLLLIFNLIPIYPLDGGRILKQMIHIYKGKEIAYKRIIEISKVTIIILTILTSILILYIHNMAFLFILAYLWYITLKNQQEYTIYVKTVEAKERMN